VTSIADHTRAFRRTLAIIAVAGVVSTLALWPAKSTADVRPASVTDSEIRFAADLSQFRPGQIISDAVFFDSSTMTESQIQSFLESKVASCRAGYTCLRDKYDTSRSIAGDAMCGAYVGGGSERASHIIFKVAQACGINPQVILVTLQKEKSLVTNREPTADHYKIAMGQGCPDTAGCDSRYYGFFNQVYGAAWQFKRYANPPGTSQYFTWYAPGKTWNVRFHTNAACGTSPVYIENQATANLYYYTPYQPNAAALRAGYGLGDACSAYGNRNFYNYFTDWFGSTLTPYGPLVTGPTRDRAYLLNAGVKFPIGSPTDLQAFGAALGGLRTVPASFLDSMPTGATVTRYVHDPRNGTLYLLEVDGSKHRFATADQVSLFGYTFNSYVNLEARLVDSFVTGGEVGLFSRAAGGTGEVFYLEGGALRYVYDTPAYAYAARGKSSYIATMDAPAHSRIPRGATFFTPNTLVKGSSSGDVLLTTPTSTVVRIPSFALAAEFGAASYKVVADAMLAKSVRTTDSLAPVVLCGTQQFIAANGAIRPLTGPATGLAVARLAATDCGAFTQGAAVEAPLFVQATTGRDVYAVMDGKLRHVHGYSQLMSLNGGRPLVVLRWEADTMNAQGFGTPLLFEGEFIKFDGHGEVYRYSSNALHHVTDYASLVALGGGKLPTIAVVPAEYAQSYQYGDSIANVPLVTEGMFVRFAGSGEIYRFADGRLHHVTDYATLVYLGGGREPEIAILPAAVSSAYPVGSPINSVPSLPDGTFVQFAGTPEVYLVSKNELRHVQTVNTLLALGGNRIPPIRQLPLEDRASWRFGAPL
jgi:hypothetical protein